MKLFSGVSLLGLIVLCSIACSAAESPKESMLSYQGFTGILNTPSAHVSDEGSMHLIFSDQRENLWRNDPQKRQENYLLSIGLFSFFELGGRLTEAPGRARDLSASIKLTTAPLTKNRAYWPVLAAGIQDVGGGSNLLQSRYAVISEDLWRFRLSAGYGFKSGRMQGGFGGVEFQAHDWVTLLGEYDTRDTNAGIRILTPEIWKTPIQLTALFKSALNHKPGNIDVAVGLTFPLDFRKKTGRALEGSAPLTTGTASEQKDNVTVSSAASPLPPASLPAPPLPTPPVNSAPAKDTATNTISPATAANLAILQDRLVAAGFINIRVGQHVNQELVVEYENTIYNHNELDALGIVAGIVSELAPKHFETVRIVIRRKGIRMAVVSAPLKELREYMQQTPHKSGGLKDALAFSYDTSFTEETSYYPRVSGFPFPTTALILAPGLQTFVGTDVGVFDYLLSFRPEILSNLWKGGVFQARWDIPLAWSKNLDDGNIYRGSRHDARMDRAMLFQGINLFPGVMANLGAGLVLHDTYGTLNELTWSSVEGTHRLRGVQAWARDPDARRTMDVYLGSYRYFYAPLDLSLEATGGQFWGQDRGFSLELKRFFSDTAISIFYKNSTTAEDKHWQAAGIQFAFPLTPRKDLQVGPIQVRGTDEWAYAQETTLAIGGQKTNDVLTQSLAVNPQPTTALYHSYYNRDRFGAGYIRQHLDRLREVWLKYGTAQVGEK